MTQTAELDAFLAANSDLELIYTMLTDPVGVSRGKGLRPHELKSPGRP